MAFENFKRKWLQQLGVAKGNSGMACFCVSGTCFYSYLYK